MYNKKELNINLGKFTKSNPYKDDIIVDPRGQWNHPGENTRIPLPGNQDEITMEGVPYSVYGVPYANGTKGQGVMMHSGQKYKFQGADYVDEFPQGFHKMPDGSMMSDSEMDYQDMELSDEEIQQYRDGGYVVEDLPKAQKGITISDPKEYAYRKSKYEDSLNLYLRGNEMLKYADSNPGASNSELNLMEDYLDKKYPISKDSDAFGRSYIHVTGSSVIGKGAAQRNIWEYTKPVQPIKKSKGTLDPKKSINVNLIKQGFATDTKSANEFKKKLWAEVNPDTPYKATDNAAQNNKLNKWIFDNEDKLSVFKETGSLAEKKERMPETQELELTPLPTRPLQTRPLVKEPTPGTVKPPASTLEWVKHPQTGTWYQIQRAVKPEDLPEYNLNTGSYLQEGGDLSLLQNRQSGGDIFTYPDRPGVTYKVDPRSGVWSINMEGSEDPSKFVPIKDPTGTRSQELRTKAVPYSSPTTQPGGNYNPFLDTKRLRTSQANQQDVVDIESLRRGDSSAESSAFFNPSGSNDLINRPGFEEQLSNSNIAQKEEARKLMSQGLPQSYLDKNYWNQKGDSSLEDVMQREVITNPNAASDIDKIKYNDWLKRKTKEYNNMSTGDYAYESAMSFLADPIATGGNWLSGQGIFPGQIIGSRSESPEQDYYRRYARLDDPVNTAFNAINPFSSIASGTVKGTEGKYDAAVGDFANAFLKGKVLTKGLRATTKGIDEVLKAPIVASAPTVTPYNALKGYGMYKAGTKNVPDAMGNVYDYTQTGDLGNLESALYNTASAVSKFAPGTSFGKTDVFKKANKLFKAGKEGYAGLTEKDQDILGQQKLFSTASTFQKQKGGEHMIMELDSNEIDWYRSQGYIVEDE